MDPKRQVEREREGRREGRVQGREDGEARGGDVWQEATLLPRLGTALCPPRFPGGPQTRTRQANQSDRAERAPGRTATHRLAFLTLQHLLVSFGGARGLSTEASQRQA